MAERHDTPAGTPSPVPAKRSGVARRRTGLDPLAMLGGVLALVVSAYGLSDGFGGVAAFADPRWLLAGAAMAVGVLMLVGSLRAGRRR